MHQLLFFMLIVKDVCGSESLQLPRVRLAHSVTEYLGMGKREFSNHTRNQILAHLSHLAIFLRKMFTIGKFNLLWFHFLTFLLREQHLGSR